MSPFKLISFLSIVAIAVAAIPPETSPESVEFTPSVTGGEPEVSTTKEPETIEKPAVNESEKSATENEETGKNGQSVSDAEQRQSVSDAEPKQSDESNQVEKEETESKEVEDMDTAATGAIDERLIDQSYVGRYNANPCKELGTSVINLLNCCSFNAGPLDATNVKKCCIGQGGNCNYNPNACCNYLQMACLPDPILSGIYTCQKADTYRPRVAPLGLNLPYGVSYGAGYGVGGAGYGVGGAGYGVGGAGYGVGNNYGSGYGVDNYAVGPSGRATYNNLQLNVQNQREVADQLRGTNPDGTPNLIPEQDKRGLIPGPPDGDVYQVLLSQIYTPYGNNPVNPYGGKK